MGKRKWSRESVVVKLREFQANGEDISPQKLFRKHGGLYYAGIGLFGTSSAMYQTAGIPSSVFRRTPPSYWTKQRIIDELRSVHANGEDMSYQTMAKEQLSLYHAGRRRFGSYSKALEAAGIPYGKFRKTHAPWTDEDIIRSIQRLSEQGFDLSSSDMREEQRSLYLAGQRRYDSWFNALEAAGISADKYRRQPARGKRAHLQSWSNERVISEIRKLAQRKEDLSHSVVMSKYPALESAARARFGNSWYEALAAAGIEPERFRKQKPSGYWTKDKVVREIKNLAAEGVDLREANIRKNYPGLLTPSQKLFGGYYNALQAAGVSPDEYRRFKPEGYWTEEQIIKTLRAMDASGSDLSYQSMRKSKIGPALDHATSRVFGGYYRALDAAGVDVSKYQKFRHGYWSRGKVIQLLHQYVARYGNLDLMPKRDLNLHAACYREFGSFKKAILEAKLDYRSLLSKKQWTQEEIKQEIMQLHQMGEDMSSSNAANHFTDLHQAAGAHFGSWENALRNAGLDYGKIRKDKLMESFKGLVFEKYVRKAFRILEWDTTYHRVFRSKEEGITVIPDFYDKRTKTWIDAKFDAGGYGVHLTIQKYLPFTDRITIIHLKGKPSDKDRKLAQFVPISALYNDLRSNGAEELVLNIIKLGQGVREPELQADFERFVRRQMSKTEQA